MSPTRLFILALAYTCVLNAMNTRAHVKFGSRIFVYFVLQVALLVVVSASVLNSPDKMYSLKRVINVSSLVLLPVMVGFYLNHTKIGRPAEVLAYFYKIIFWLGLLLAWFGIFQMGTGFMQRTAEVRSLGGIPIARLNSFFVDPNFFAFVLSIPILILIADVKEKIYNITLVQRAFCLLPMFICLFATGSRGGQLIVLFGLMMYWLQKRYPKGAGWQKWLGYAIIVILPLILYSYNFFFFVDLLQLTGNYDTSTESAASRLFTWYSGIRSYLEGDLFLGIGPGNYVTLDKGKYLPVNYVFPWMADNISRLAGHSNILEMLVESGPLALLLYVGSLVWVYHSLFVNQKEADQRLILPRSIYIGLSVGSLLLTYYSVPVLLLVGVWIWVAERSELDSKLG